MIDFFAGGKVFSASWNEKTGSLRLTGTYLIAINVLNEFLANCFEYKDIQIDKKYQ